MIKFLLFLFYLGSSFAIDYDFDKEIPPRWNDVYTVRGQLNIPYAELHEPFYAWFDSKNEKSRIDYYGGMVKTYQLGPSAFPKYGTSIKVAPVTTEKVLNKITCLQINGTDHDQMDVQTVLPDMTDFHYIDTETMKDSDTAKWRMVITEGDKVNKYTVWVKYRKTTSGDPIPIPVRYETKGFNTLLGSHYDHYYIDYSDYDIDEIDPSVFEVETKQKCTSFPGPGSKHRATFNPMMEFMHPACEAHMYDEFHRFQAKHNKKYDSDIEHVKRINIFRQNLRYISSTNRARRGYTVAVNHLADRTSQELEALRGRKYTGPNHGLPFPYNSVDLVQMSNKLPSEFDWRLFGAVTPVKDQSVCGSCYLFGAVATVEGALFLHNGGHLVRLSEQAPLDCSWGFGNNGCDGGSDYRVYEWIMKHGLPTDEEYGGYLGQDGYCHIDNVTLVTSIKGWVNVTSKNENALKLALFKHGPISVAMDASHKSFSFYSNGVYYEPKCKNGVEELDHAVLLVGYGALNGAKYWLVQNSWSNMWGNDGYVLMSMRNDNCGIAAAPTYVVL